jgi:hypothetical protein
MIVVESITVIAATIRLVNRPMKFKFSDPNTLMMIHDNRDKDDLALRPNAGNGLLILEVSKSQRRITVGRTPLDE